MPIQCVHDKPGYSDWFFTWIDWVGVHDKNQNNRK